MKNGYIHVCKPLKVSFHSNDNDYLSIFVFSNKEYLCLQASEGILPPPAPLFPPTINPYCGPHKQGLRPDIVF